MSFTLSSTRNQCEINNVGETSQKAAVDRVTDPEDRHPFFDQIEKLFKNKTRGRVDHHFHLYIGCPPRPVISLTILTRMPLRSAQAASLDSEGSTKNLLGTDDLGRDMLSVSSTEPGLPDVRHRQRGHRFPVGSILVRFRLLQGLA